MQIYEERHDFDANYLFCGSGRDFSFPMHVHRCPELFLVTEGQIKVTVEKKEYILGAGDAALIWSHQIHSYVTEGKGAYELCIFAPELVPRFFNAHASQLPEDPRLPAKKCPLVAQLVHALGRETELFTVKGLLYLLCGEAEKCLTFRDRKRGRKQSGDPLLFQILTYVNKKYQGDCSLEAVAAALRYEKTYVAKFFSRSVGITLAQYVLQLRLAKAGELLLNTDDNIIDIGEASGFNSSRSFNRNFSRYYHMTPSAYRANRTGELRRIAESSSGRQEL